MGVVQGHARMALAQPADLVSQRLVVGRVVARAALGDLGLAGRLAKAVQRLAVEGCRRTEFGRRLPGIERDPVGIAVDVDDRARDRRLNDGRAELFREIVQRAQAPVRVASRDPGADESGLAVAKIRSGVRDADDQRRVAALDKEPVGGHAASNSGQRTSPAAATNSSEAISAAAATISGWK